jgi:hypothetical protein
MTKPLFSVPVLCDGNMEVTFRKDDMIVKDENNKIVLTGKGDTATPYGSSQLCSRKYVICSSSKQSAMSQHYCILPTVRTTKTPFPN